MTPPEAGRASDQTPPDTADADRSGPDRTKPAPSAAAWRAALVEAMKDVFAGDTRRIEHTLKVLAHAETLLAAEPGRPAVVVAAAALHDVGIPAAEAEHGSAAGRYQEIEGPPIARRILHDLGADEATIDHVSRIVANHHTAREIDTPEFRIVWDADWLVNLPEEFPDAGARRLCELIDRLFKTPTGRDLARRLYVDGGD